MSHHVLQQHDLYISEDSVANPANGAEASADVFYTPKAHAADSLRGVLLRRCLAYFFDLLIIGAIIVVLHKIAFSVGLAAFAFGWILYGSLYPLAGIFYSALTIGGAWNATWGMRIFAIEVRIIDGRSPDGWFAALHAALFYATMLAPVVLIVPFFSSHKRCLHDIFVGAVIVRR